MIPFLRRKKEEPVVVDCYTFSSYAYNYAKIDHARKHIPEWFKNQKALTEAGTGTIKHCPAVADYYTKGIVIPLWGEVEITVNPKGSAAGDFTWAASNEDFDLNVGSHDKVQWGGFGSADLRNIKFMCPWHLKTREEVNFLWSQPTWSQPDTFRGLAGLPGVVGFKTNGGTHINYVVELQDVQQRFTLAPLTPMAILHPLTDRKIELRHHLISGDAYRRLSRRAGGMLLGAEDADTVKAARKTHARKAAFWKKADELNKCPFK